MKKYLFYSLLFVVGLCIATACTDSEGGTEGGDNGGNAEPNTPVASVEQAQSEIDRVGKELIGKINAEQLEPIITLAQYAENTFLDNYDKEEDYIITPDPYYPMRKLMRTLRKCAEGDVALLASKRAIYDIYTLTDYYGHWVWDEDDLQWNETDGIYNEASLTYRFNHEGKPCIAEVKGSEEVFEWNAENADGELSNVIVRVPKVITATVKENNVELMRLTINTTACDYKNKSYSINSSFETCGYKITSELLDDNKKVKANAYLYVNGEKLISMTGEANGNHLADVDRFTEEDFDVETDLKDGILTYDILNSLILKINANNSYELREALDFDGYYFYTEGYSYSDKNTALKNAQKAAEVISREIPSILHFSNSSYSCPITWQPVLTDEYSYTSTYYTYYEGEYELEPVINFENGTTYTFGKYFTDNRFQSLIDVFEELLEDFDRIL